MNYDERILKRFVKDYSLPIQVYNKELMDYYISLYDPILQTKQKWKMFEEALLQFNNVEEFIAYGHRLSESVINAIKETTSYKKLINCDMDRLSPISKEVEGILYTKSGNIYNPNNSGKYYISVDLKKANYQALKSVSDELVLNTDFWEQLMEKFTNIEYFKQSKYIRQIILGNLNTNRILHQEIFLTERILRYLVKTGYPKDRFLIFTTDEIVMECLPQMFLGDRGCNLVKKDIKESLGIDTNVEDFKLLYMGNDTYVKEHGVSPPTFKGGSSIYFPQAYKYYSGIPLCDKDLYFTYEKQLAKFIEPIKWGNLT